MLGAILINNHAFNQAAEVIDAQDFFRDAHRRIFEKMVALTDRSDPVDLVTLKDELVRSGELDEVGGPAYISALTDGVPRSANVEHYARIVKEKSTLRRLIQSATDVLSRAYDAEEDADTLLDESSAPEPLPPIRLVDFHCELTSEKNALGLYLDGRVSAVVGTHTHVVTGDERILPGGTAYQTDLGMTGPVWSVIGFDPKTVLPRFINALPTRFEVGEGPVVFNALQVDIDPATGRALAMERIQRLVEG